MSRRAYVYVIGSEGSPLKIGVSENPHKRLRSIQTSHPRRVSLYAKWEHDDSIALEREAHRLLAFRRLSGEWFDVSRREAVESVEQAILNLSEAGALFAEVAPDPPPEEEIIPLPGRPAIATMPPPKIADVLPQIYVKAVQPEEYGPWPPFRLAYVREIVGATIGTQAAEVESAGVDPRDIWIEKGGSRVEFISMMKDYRSGDICVIWSPAVVGDDDDVASLRVAAAKKNAFVEFLHK